MVVPEKPIKLEPIHGQVVATGVSAEDYMAHYAESHHEWVEGTVIKMSPSTLRHLQIRKYLEQLLDTYFSLRPIGQTLGEPFVLRLDTEEKRSRREPYLMVVLAETAANLTETYLDGPADICIEIVSDESSTRDHGEKFHEYERGGVREYWIIDPLRRQCRFNRLNDEGRYALIYPQNDAYTTPRLPGLRVHVPTLWSDPLPNVVQVVAAVQAMLNE